MQLVVAATNQNGLYKKHMFCRKNVNKLKMRKIVCPGVTVKIQQVAVRGNYENPTNDAKGEDE